MSVETPVAKRPLDATAREPPRSTERELMSFGSAYERQRQTHTSNGSSVERLQAVGVLLLDLQLELDIA